MRATGTRGLGLCVRTCGRFSFADAVFASALDRGCFHYVDAKERPRYVDELARVLLPGGRLLLRACTSSEGHPNGVDKAVVRRAFDGWIVARIETRMMSSDIREMPAVVARLEHP